MRFNSPCGGVGVRDYLSIVMVAVAVHMFSGLTVAQTNEDKRSDPFLAESFLKLEFNEQERRVIELLMRDHQAFDHLVILLGFSEIIDAPKTPKQLLEKLATESVDIDEENWADASKGFRKLVAVSCRDNVYLFLEGRHPDKIVGRSKPQKKNLKFFKSLHDYYESIRCM